jgi:hypothetical protein
LIFSNSKNNHAQLLLKDVRGQVYSHSRKVWICEKLFEFLFLRLIVVNNGATQNAMKLHICHVIFVSLSIFSFPISCYIYVVVTQ